MTLQPVGHIPVLTDELVALLDIREGETVVDATVGLGGHARLFAESMGASGRLIGLDVDPSNLERADAALVDASCRVDLVHANFKELPTILAGLGVLSVDVLFADLGVSSTQLDDPSRGISFREDGPLDMRMDPRLTTTASDLVNRLKERELGDLLFYNAQETFSRKIARAICNARREHRITRTGELVKVVAGALHVDPASRRSKIHPATRTFQALRIAVNDELGALNSLLEAAPDVLAPGGRIAVIAFHSLEDKPVKLDFRKNKAADRYQILTKRPIIATPRERVGNPRSRSAKLRVALRLDEQMTSSDGIG